MITESETMSLIGSDIRCNEICFSDSYFTVNRSWTRKAGPSDSSSGNESTERSQPGLTS